jgi:hypothetical protein
MKKLKKISKDIKRWIEKNLAAVIISHIMWAIFCSLPFNLYPDHPWLLSHYLMILLLGSVVIAPASFLVAWTTIKNYHLIINGDESIGGFVYTIVMILWFALLITVSSVDGEPFRFYIFSIVVVIFMFFTYLLTRFLLLLQRKDFFYLLNKEIKSS